MTLSHALSRVTLGILCAHSIHGMGQIPQEEIPVKRRRTSRQLLAAQKAPSRAAAEYLFAVTTILGSFFQLEEEQPSIFNVAAQLLEKQDAEDESAKLPNVATFECGNHTLTLWSNQEANGLGTVTIHVKRKVYEQLPQTYHQLSDIQPDTLLPLQIGSDSFQLKATVQRNLIPVSLELETTQTQITEPLSTDSCTPPLIPAPASFVPGMPPPTPPSLTLDSSPANEDKYYDETAFDLFSRKTTSK